MKSIEKSFRRWSGSALFGFFKMFQAVPVLRLGRDDQHAVQQVEGDTLDFAAQTMVFRINQQLNWLVV